MDLIAATMSDQQAVTFSRLAIDAIEREYPNKPSQVMRGDQDVRSPRELHPVFYGCYDWHSSVHGHWLLVRLLKTQAGLSNADEIRALLDRQLTADKLADEARYFDIKENLSFERAYGWAWVLRLAAELRRWDDPQARQWAANLRPLEERLVELTKEYLPRLSYPVRTGVHPDTAFALAQSLDYARAVNDTDFQRALVEYSRAKYLADRDYPARFEPSGEDFFSPALNEADLMRRVLEPEEFAAWLEQFLPGLGRGDANSTALLSPVKVTDVTDPKLVHLAGLNLSRGWCLQGIIHALPANDERRPHLAKSLARHREAGLAYVESGHYEGEHWLATFAVYLLTEAGVANP